MPAFDYSALDLRGHTRAGTVDAATPRDAVRCWRSGSSYRSRSSLRCSSIRADAAAASARRTSPC